MRFKPRIKFNQNTYTVNEKSQKNANSRANVVIATFQVKKFLLSRHSATNSIAFS